MTYIISIGFLIVLFFGGIITNKLTVGGFVDVPSAFVVAITIFTALIATNSIRDFFRALKVAISKKEYAAFQISNSITAVTLVIHSLFAVAGFFLFVNGSILISLWDSKSEWGVYMALALLTLFYAGEIIIVLIPVKYLLQKKLFTKKRSLELKKQYNFSKIPCLFFIIFLLGFAFLFLLLTATNIFVVTNYPLEIANSLIKMYIFLVVTSYIILFSAKLFIAYFRAIKICVTGKCNESLLQLTESKNAVLLTIILRFLFAVIGAVFLFIRILSNIENAQEAQFQFCCLLFLIALSFFNALYLLLIHARIEKCITFKLYSAI